LRVPVVHIDLPGMVGGLVGVVTRLDPPLLLSVSRPPVAEAEEGPEPEED
jgi:hypothetical protein